MKSFYIGKNRIGYGCPPYIIAEAGINHNGDISIAKQMINVAKEVGADAIKFQTFSAREFIQDSSLKITYKSQGKEITESMLEMFERCEFSKSEWQELKGYCQEVGITFLSTPQNITDLDFLLSLGIDAIKVGSDDFTNIPLLKYYSSKKKPMLVSCGMASADEIDYTVELIRSNGNDMVLFLCTSQYPTEPENVNINRLITMKEKYSDIVLGLSDHSVGNEAAVMAVALGAKVFEKHFTLSHDFEGPDHWFSEEPDKLREWVISIKRAYLMTGTSKIGLTDAEKDTRIIAHRSITTRNRINKGEQITEDNICLRRPGTGLEPKMWDKVIGKIASRDLLEGYQIKLSDLEE